MNYWDQIREYLRLKISAESYDNWLSGTSWAGVSGSILFVSVPDRGTRSWLESEYASLVNAALAELGLPVNQVSYEPAPIRNGQEQAIAAVENSEIDNGVASLNPKFTFDTFVVGACNQFAHAAARSVAINPSSMAERGWAKPI